MIEFVFSQVTLNEPQFCDKLNLFRIMTVKTLLAEGKLIN